MGVGKRYKLVSADKLVSAVFNRHIVGIEMLLLTFSANEIEIEKEDEVFVTFQAMIQVCQPQSTYKLKEWKFKPTFILN